MVNFSIEPNNFINSFKTLIPFFFRANKTDQHQDSASILLQTLGTKQSNIETKALSSLDNSITPPSKDISHVFVFSARHTIECVAQDSLLSDRTADEIDKHDDLERLLLGIQTAYEITAARLNKPVDQLSYRDLIKGPYILYNGSDDQNNALLKALFKTMKDSENKLLEPSTELKKRYALLYKVPKSCIYPISNFLINPLEKNIVHTKGQFINLATHANELKLKHAKLLLVSHDYHKGRIGRLVNEGLLPSDIEVVACRFVGERKGDKIDRLGEEERIISYQKKYGLPKKPSMTIFFDRGTHRLLDGYKEEASHFKQSQDDLLLDYRSPRIY